MTPPTTHGQILNLLAPECILVLTALVVLASSFKCSVNSGNSRPLTWMSILGLILAGGVLIFNQPLGSVLGNTYFVSDATRWIKLAIAALGIGSLWLHLGISQRFPHQGEFHALLLLAIVGMFLLVGSDHLLMIFVALELTALSLYILTGFEKSRAISTQTALKYFLIGGVSAAFILYGFSLIYGVSGQMHLSDIRVVLDDRPMDSLLTIGLIMSLAGFGFKIAAAPFHMWAPDVYQEAPTPVASLIASASKVAGFFVLGRFLWTGFEGHAGSIQGWNNTSGWLVLLAVLAGGSMIIGNLAALRQSNLRRLLAYSAVAHAGYALLGIMSPDPLAPASVSFYLITYGIAIIGVFALLQVLEENERGKGWESLQGLRHRAPWMAACLMILILSLAGIPPLVGFLAKFNVFIAALKSSGSPLGLILLVALALGASAVSLYYYLGILKAAFCSEESSPAKLRTNAYQTSLIGMSAVAVLILGIFPGILLSRLVHAFGI
jgi:NADH-quinone oxidoreductase subunit N